jgi:hypothetical protein
VRDVDLTLGALVCRLIGYALERRFHLRATSELKKYTLTCESHKSVCSHAGCSHNLRLSCYRYEKQEQMEKEQKAEEEKHSQAVADDQNTRDAAKPFEQAWKASPQNERCRWCCGLVCLVIVLWGPLFAYSSSDILGQRKSARVEGVRVQLDVRALAGDCNRPDPDGCTVDTYTLWSTNSAKLRGITTAADMYGPFQSNVEQSNRATNRIQQQLEETYK